VVARSASWCSPRPYPGRVSRDHIGLLQPGDAGLDGSPCDAEDPGVLTYADPWLFKHQLDQSEIEGVWHGRLASRCTYVAQFGPLAGQQSSSWRIGPPLY
jgi:hypothetical protein